MNPYEQHLSNVDPSAPPITLARSTSQAHLNRSAVKSTGSSSSSHGHLRQDSANSSLSGHPVVPKPISKSSSQERLVIGNQKQVGDLYEMSSSNNGGALNGRQKGSSSSSSVSSSSAGMFARGSMQMPAPDPRFRNVGAHDNNNQNSNNNNNVRGTPTASGRPSSSSLSSAGYQVSRNVQRVQLFRGNLVLTCPVPDILIGNVRERSSEEVTSMRYTAVTCDPNDFVHSNYTLRPALYGRPTELMITMTMYNEDEDLFMRSMSAVFKNIAYLCSRSRSSVWGGNGWQKVVVCLVADGRHKVSPRVLQILGIMGVFQEGVMKSEVNGRAVQAHLFEYTAQIEVDPGKLDVKPIEFPVQILFCLKEDNKKKLNSHRWAFNAFCPILRPNICVLLDVGTKPTSQSIYYLWKEFDLNASLGGACGEIAVDIGYAGKHLFNPLVAAQNFEYKMSNILDKPLESVFGFISVLPGAFSAYRYAALVNTAPGSGPLASYFEGEKLHEGSANVYKANMYLAEDRVLCFELVAKPKCDWVLKYVKAAKAVTDVPDGIPEFISQRRRWLNGAFFAMVYALSKWHRIWATDHSFSQKVWFQIQLIYNCISLFFSWFGLALFYLSFFFLGQLLTDPADPANPFGSVGPYIFDASRQLYIFAIVIIFIVSLGNRPQGAKGIYIFTFVLFAIIMAMMMSLSGYAIYVALKPGLASNSNFSDIIASSSVFRDIMIALGAQYGVYFLSSFLYMDPWHMITSFVQYLFLLPSYINVLNIYSFCNTNDVSWGTKGDNKPKKLGAAKMSKEHQDSVDIELPFKDKNDRSNLNMDYTRWLETIVQKPKEVPKKPDLATQLEDWYRSFRTTFVLSWMFSNAAMIVAFSHPAVVKALGGAKGGNIFLAAIFYSFLGLSAIRFVGSLVYIVMHWKNHYGSCRCC